MSPKPSPSPRRGPPGLVAGLALLATLSCAPQANRSAEQGAPVQELNLYIWTSYHSPEAIARFEAEHHAHVNISLYDNNEAMALALRAPGAAYDVVVPTDYMVLALARDGLLRPLDEAQLPNLRYLDPAFDRLKSEGGPRYNVAYLWGTTGIAWRTDRVAEPVQSWSALFDPRYTGHVVMLDDMREAFAAALHTLGASINSRDPAQIAAARDLLIAQRPLVLAYDSTTFAERLQKGDAWLAQGYSGELAKVARESGGTITYAVPREGCSLTTDNLVIPASAPHADLAHEFINFMLDPQVAAETTNATGYATANAGARPYIRPVLLNDPAVFPDPERLARCEPLLGLGDFTSTLGVAWEEIKKQ